jgi:hypothetical protein
MLRKDIIEAAREGRFHIYPISHVEEGIKLLSGLEPGAANDAGEFPEGSFNYKVSTVLHRMAEHRHEYSSHGKGSDDESHTVEHDDEDEEVGEEDTDAG